MTRSARSGQVCRLTAADLPPDIPLSAHHLCPLLSSCHSSPVPAFLVSRCPLALTAADQLRAQVVAAVSCFHPPSCCLCVCLCLSACVRALRVYSSNLLCIFQYSNMPHRVSVKQMRANAADRQRRYRERKAAELKISHRNKFVIRSIINVRQWKGALQYEIVWRSISPGLSDRTGWYDVSTALNTDEKAAADGLLKQSDDLVEKDEFCVEKCVSL